MERTDFLASKLGVSLRSLAPIIGFSVASLFGYRSGSIPISNKAWSKLERAEQAAGITKEKGQADTCQLAPEAGNAESCGNPKESEMGAEKIPELLRRIAGALEEIARKLPPLE